MSAVRRYNKRQRKKKHVGEFQELGFLVEAEVVGAFGEAERDAFIDRFLEEAVEANGLAFGGGLNADFSGFVVAEKAYAAVDENHRALIAAWLNSQSNLKNVVVGPLRDAWYGWG
jgi:uncharacterized protein YggL (DUF469 family)